MRDLQMAIPYKPAKYKSSGLIFFFLNFLCLLRVSNTSVHRQEDGRIYSYGTVLLHAEITIKGFYKVSST
jgi:hypothetical protein